MQRNNSDKSECTIIAHVKLYETSTAKAVILIHIASIKQSSVPNNLLLSVQLKEISRVSFKNFR